MACCGGSGPRPQRIRTQAVTGDKRTKQVVQRRLSQSATPTSVERQYIIPRQQCEKCGYPGMSVLVAGRERIQCSNVNCRSIIQ